LFFIPFPSIWIIIIDREMATTTTTTTVLVTGGSGFVASHLIAALLRAGVYTVRTTIRNPSREPDVREMLRNADIPTTELDHRLSFHIADLTRDEGWAEAVRGCTYVLHVASPFPSGTIAPADAERLLIGPAREGTLRVLRAVRDDRQVKRVVFTSPFAAVGYGHPPSSSNQTAGGRGRMFTEEDWSVLDNPSSPLPVYHKSKVLAEKAAWELTKETPSLELSVINPTAIFGPVLGKDFSSSIQLVQQLVAGGIPACPRLYFAAVDVRDLAELHIRAMTAAEAKGQRFIASAEGGRPSSLLEIAGMIREARPERAGKVPTKEIPNWGVRLMALFNPRAKEMVPQLGDVRIASNDRAVRVWG
jgi:nucleoside-diphosphate-sugar epimerase